MAELPYIKLYVEDMHTATEFLSDEEFGRYMRLIMLTWRMPDNALPGDPLEVCRLLRVTGHKRSKVEAVLERFFEKEGGKWRQKRLDFERSKARKSYHQKLEANRSRWRKNKEKGSTGACKKRDAGADPTHNPNISKRNGDDQNDFLDPDADLIKSGKPFLCTQIAAQKARELIADGSVTEDECKAVGVL